MDKQATKELIYGGLLELMNNRKYYYYSNIGSNYCHWTDDGKLALQEFMSIMAVKMLEAEEKQLTKRAKELVINGLKGETV